MHLKLMGFHPLLLAAALGLATHGARAESAHALTVGEGLVDPLGYHRSVPLFSWKLPAAVKSQSAYRLEVTDGRTTLWDSGWVKSGQSTFVRYGGTPLQSRQRVRWRVRFGDEQGREYDWSRYASLELGLLSALDWQARWIRPMQAVDANKEPVGYLRRTFSLAKPVAQARLYVTARGLFDFKVNGQPISSDHFANGFTSYSKRIDTLTYDITKQLKEGRNQFDVMLGTGWYAGRLPFNAKVVGPYGQDTALLAQAEITFLDGTTEIVVSDDNWNGSFSGPIVTSSFYDGEVYDARRGPGDWAPVFVQKDLGLATLAPKPFPPVRAVTTLVPKTITQPQPGRYIFDLGQNMVGWARIQVPVEKGQTVTLRFAEMLNADGTLYTVNYRSAKSTDEYTAAQTGEVRWEPHFTFHGFRYVELSGLPASAAPQLDWVKGVVLHSALPTMGQFFSSHAELNQLQSNISWGWRGNSLDIPTDCPQRDERMGWTGDAQAFCATSMFNTDAHGFWKSWLRSMRDDQYSDGAIPAIIPAATVREVRSSGWMDAATIIPWDVYVRTGDTDILEENYAMMERLVGWYRSNAVDGLLPHSEGFGDWLQPYSQPQDTTKDKLADRRGDTPLPLLSLAFYARGAQILADTAQVLGRNEDRRRYLQEAAGVRTAFTKKYFDAEGRLKEIPETQTAYVLAIAFNLIPATLKPKAGANLTRLVHEAGGHLRTGFLGTPFLTQALDQTGHADVAAELLFRETYPSWLYPINQGATTMWERWNSYTRESGFGDAAMNSFNHYAYGAIGQWLYERVAGLSPDAQAPGYRHFFVRPLVVPQLDSAEASLETPYGRARSAWKKENGRVVLEVTVPPNTTATVELPDERSPQVLAAGSHRFDFAP